MHVGWREILRRAAWMAGGAAGVFVAGVVLVAAEGAAPATSAAATSPAHDGVLPYKDTSLSFEARVADLVARMTLQEKAEQLEGSVPRSARLGIPAIDWWTEGIHGVSRAGTATVFPQAIGMAAAWDPGLMHDVADVVSTEARAKFVPSGEQYRGITIWAPTINMARDPRWGRTEETYGEDPFLTGRLGVAFVKGLQGDDPKYLKTVATPKHFAVHSQETGRHNTSFDVPDTVLHDYYLPAFEACIREGKAASIMAAFSGIDGVPDTANTWLLTDLLRADWGFQGAVVTDRQAVLNLMSSHHYVTTMEQAVTAALTAGVDVMANASPLTGNLTRAVQAKQLDMKVVDRAVTRNLMLRFRLGMFDPKEMVPFAQIPASAVGTKEHVAMALKAAQESFVLLKNDPAPRGFGFDKLLPLDLRRVDSIAVLGPYANTRQFGAYSGNPAAPSPTPLEAIRAAAGDRIMVRTAEWTNADATVAAAESSDVVIVVLGLNSSIENEGIDRSTLDLPVPQQRLLEKVVLANPLTVAVLEGGSPIGMAYIKQNVPAALMVWYPGEQGGIALAQTLFGKVNPSGKLPVTFYHSATDLPPLGDYDIRKGRTYMYLQKPADYPFGHGLSYTTFVYRGLKVDRPAMAANGSVAVSLDVANTGGMDGDEVVQLYVHKKEGPPPVAAAPAARAPAVTTTRASTQPARPIKQLKGFQRVSIPRGQTRPVTFTLAAAGLACWDQDKQAYVAEPGAYEILVGASSDDIWLRAEVVIR